MTDETVDASNHGRQSERLTQAIASVRFIQNFAFANPTAEVGSVCESSFRRGISAPQDRKAALFEEGTDMFNRWELLGTHEAGVFDNETRKRRRQSSLLNDQAALQLE